MQQLSLWMHFPKLAAEKFDPLLTFQLYFQLSTNSQLMNRYLVLGAGVMYE